VVKKEKYEQQHETAQRNERRILNALSMGKMTFGELKTATGLTDAGLAKVLKRMASLGKIHRKEEGKKKIYSIASGTTAKELWYLGDTINDLRSNGAKYIIDFSDNHQSEAAGYGASFGILSHLFLDKDIGKTYNPFTKRDIFELEKLVFDRIKENIGNNKFKINHKINDQKDKKIVLAFDIDYDSLLKALEEYSGNKEEKMVNARRRELRR
jgi:DNA-binding transcriptional ArsR family regulator